MQHLIEMFLEHHVAQLSIAKEMAGTIRLYFSPLAGYARADVTPLLITAWVHEIGRHSHSQANKSLSILRSMFEQAKNWGLYTGENPAARVKKYPKHARTRFVQPEEMPRLLAALAREDEDVQCFFLLCLLVGCRRMEGLTLQWRDLSEGLWTKAHTKTGVPHRVPIPASLWRRLMALPKVNAYVFATKHGHRSRSSTFDQWASIRTAAGLGDVTIHDLRRTCASWLACSGENLAVIGRGVLNHTSLSHTGVYARLNTTPVSRALEANSVRMLGG